MTPSRLLDAAQTTTGCSSGNIRGMYNGMKKAFGTSATKIAPLKSAAGDIISGKHSHRYCCREHLKAAHHGGA